MAKWVYSFGEGRAEGRADMRALLGGKGANLAEMCNLGLPVPPGFTITTEICTYYYAQGRTYPPDLSDQVASALGELSERTGRFFGDEEAPLLLSVRSGARASMPGMMDTVLNLGLNDETVQALSRRPTSASPTTPTAASSRCIPTWCSASTSTSSRNGSTTSRTSAASTPIPTSAATIGLELTDDYKVIVTRELGIAFPQDPQRAALGRHRRRLRLVDEPARHHLPQASTTSLKTGARRSTSRQWSSATWARPRRPASPSRAIPRPATRHSTASTWSMPRARTSSPASARRRT